MSEAKTIAARMSFSQFRARVEQERREAEAKELKEKQDRLEERRAEALAMAEAWFQGNGLTYRRLDMYDNTIFDYDGIAVPTVVFDVPELEFLLEFSYEYNYDWVLFVRLCCIHPKTGEWTRLRLVDLNYGLDHFVKEVDRAKDAYQKLLETPAKPPEPLKPEPTPFDALEEAQEFYIEFEKYDESKTASLLSIAESLREILQHLKSKE